MTKHIYGYFEDSNDLRISTITKWEDSLTYSAAQRYLREHLLKSLKNDFNVAFDSYKNKTPQDAGFFALPRIIFPYISFLGSLYTGRPNEDTKSALMFMDKYMGSISREYKDLAGYYYIGFRHGLMHTNMPKIFTYAKQKFGWTVTFADATGENRTDNLGGNKLLYPKLFCDDLCGAIELYIADFDNTRKRNRLFRNFKTGFIEMAKVHSIKDTPLSGRKFLRKSLRYLKF